MSQQDRVACVIKKLADPNNDTVARNHDFSGLWQKRASENVAAFERRLGGVAEMRKYLLAAAGLAAWSAIIVGITAAVVRHEGAPAPVAPIFSLPAVPFKARELVALPLAASAWDPAGSCHHDRSGDPNLDYALDGLDARGTPCEMTEEQAEATNPDPATCHRNPAGDRNGYGIDARGVPCELTREQQAEIFAPCKTAGEQKPAWCPGELKPGDPFYGLELVYKPYPPAAGWSTGATSQQ